MTPVVRLMRPQQWVKNAFVAAPLVFAHRLGNAESLVRASIAVAAFCLLSGAVYAFNDVRDVEADRLHPTKRHRPVATGQISKRSAVATSVAAAAIGLGACLAVRWQLAALASLYLAQNIAYSVRLKRIAYVDIALIAAGFLVRVLAGSAAIDVPTSGWVLVCTALLAVLLALGKRAHELTWAARDESSGATRAALAGYKLSAVRIAMPILAVITCTAYVLYTIAPHTVAMFGTHALVWSAPFVALGIARFLSLSLWHPKPEPPTEAMLRDPIVLGNLVIATAIVLHAIYG